jgi:hypothetical protein
MIIYTIQLNDQIIKFTTSRDEAHDYAVDLMHKERYGKIYTIATWQTMARYYYDRSGKVHYPINGD